MEWTREKTLLLISEYRQRRGLWDMTCDEYRKKDVKQKLLNEVSGVIGGNIPIQELEKKFHTLRTQYHREISRMKRKEPYNSKWFGFKNLSFLSSPYACRSTKGRLKTDQKFVLGEVSADNNSSSMNEEYSIRKSHPSKGAQELEKLIEETTKDVDDMDEQDVVEESKPKLPKDLNGPASYVHQINEDEPEPVETQPQQPQHHHHHHQPATTMIDLHPHSQYQNHHHHHHQPTAMETVSFQANDSGELHYQSTSNASNSSSVHVVPTRIIKIQRRDTINQEDGYFEEQQGPASMTPAPKRIYYDPNASTTTILTTSSAAPSLSANTSTPNVSNGTTSIATGTLRLPRLNNVVNSSTLSPPKAPSPPILAAAPTSTSPRDEFSTYGEYVANEMRAMNNREVLIALKHKINTAIFEANMAELQK
ncbi:uncharacterized protein [Drosophila tropicalis]|uniref:uncharacterized protein n=1 Tax=Drosophila tropicalis TaxID=46794 RepID=UPI0035AC045A